MKNSKVIYLHRKKTDNSVFYVGMGNLKRAYCKQREKWWNRVVDKYGYVIEIFRDGLTSEEAFELEIELIAKYGRIDLGNGQLINQTNGGITVQGMSKSSLDKKKKSLKSVKRTEEWKSNISKALKGKVKGKEWRDKISKTITGTKLSEDVKQKMRLSNKSKIVTAVKMACYDYYSSEFIAEYPSVRQAAIELGCKETSISNNLHNRSNCFNSKTLNKKIKCQKI